MSYDAVLQVWNAAGETVQHLATGLQSEYHSFAVSRNGKLMALGRRDGGVVLLDAETGKRLGVCPSFRAGPVLGVAISNGGERVAAAQWRVAPSASTT